MKETKKEKKSSNNSAWEDEMVRIMRANTSYPILTQFRFHKVRRWRFDAAIPELMIACELNGGVWTGGRHIRPAGYEKDLEKINTAQLMGWKVYQFTPRMLNQGWIERILKPNETT